MIKDKSKKKKYLFSYVMHTFFAIILAFLFNIELLFADVVKCTYFYNNNDVLGGKIDKCRENTSFVQMNNGTLEEISKVDNISNIVRDSDNNIPVYCGDVLPTNSSSESSVVNTESEEYKKAKKLINNIKLCGHDWNNFAYKSNIIEDNINKQTWYPFYGSYSNSYQYKLNKVLSSIYSCEDFINRTGGITCTYELIKTEYNNGSAYERVIESKIVDIFENKLESIPSGSEKVCKTLNAHKECYSNCIKNYDVDEKFNDLAISCLDEKRNSDECKEFNTKCLPILSLFDINNKYCEGKKCSVIRMISKNINNRFYREKLYNGKEFKFPLISNESIDKSYNDIFSSTKVDEIIYSSGSGCFDPRLDEEKGYSGNEQRYYFRGKEAANYACERFTYTGSACVNINGTKYDKNSKECAKLFNLAKRCCEKRRNGGICAYYTDDNFSTVINGIKYNYKIDVDGKIINKNYNTLCSNYDIASGSNVCKLNIESDKYVTLNSYYGKLYNDSLTRTNNDAKTKICITTKSLNNYNFNLLGGTEIKDLYCDGYYESCENPYNNKGNNEEKNKYNLWNNSYYNDYNKIWITSSRDNNKISAPTYGKAKNFCTQNIHCVDSSEELSIYDSFSTQNSFNGKFLPAVCYDFTKGSSQNLEYPVSLDNPVIEYISGKNTKGFTAPIVECIFETVNNMFLNKSGISSCKDPDEKINYEGLCGNDTFGPPINIRNEKYDAKYSGIYNAYNYIIGEELPDEYNIFRKIQSSIQNIIKAALVVGIVIISLKFLIKGELNIFDNTIKKQKGLIVGMLKFVIVIYFSISNAWQSTFYNWLDTTMKFMYQKAFDLSLLGYDNYKNQNEKIICDIRTENETITKAYNRNCNFKRIKDICNMNCSIYETSGMHTYNIPTGIQNIAINLYGARGGFSSVSLNNYGKGGHTYGELDTSKLPSGINKLYVYIGGVPDNTCKEYQTGTCIGYFSCGGYNGGGNGARGYNNNGNGGGGATDIRIINGEWNNLKSLKSRIMVAGGGGGSGRTDILTSYYRGGNGGGGNMSGTAGTGGNNTTSLICYGTGGTLKKGGTGGNCDGNCRTDENLNLCIKNGLCTDTESCNNKKQCKEFFIAQNYSSCEERITTNDCRYNNGSFGKGGDGREGYIAGSGGGGGYYGGGASSKVISTTGSELYVAGAGGGSGYIDNNIIQNGGGETGVWTDGGKATICYFLDGNTCSSQNIENYSGQFSTSELPDSVSTSNEETCVIENITQTSTQKITNRKCYSNCSELIRNKDGDIILKETKDVAKDVETERNIFQSNLPVYNEYKVSKMITDNDKETKIENKYYSNCRSVTEKDKNGKPIYNYSHTYDGCYFGDNKYPVGKGYLAIFDSLDCKLANYFQLSFGNIGAAIIVLVIFLLSAPIGIILFVLSTFMFFLLFMIVFKIFYLFLVNIIAVNILVFVSPIIFPTLLFEKYKGIFDSWFKYLIGFCLQLTLVLIFAGFFIGTIDKFGLGGAEFINHDLETGRLPELYCPSDSSTSILCLFSQNSFSPPNRSLFGGIVSKYLGIGPLIYAFNNIRANGFSNIFFTILGFAIVLFALLKFVDKIPNMVERIVNSSSTINSKVGVVNSMKNTTRTAANAKEIVRGTGMVGTAGIKSVGRGIGNIGKGIGSRYNSLKKEGFKGSLKKKGDKTKDDTENSSNNLKL